MLKDKSTFEENGLKENDFLVLLVNKAKPAPTQKKPEPQPEIKVAETKQTETKTPVDSKVVSTESATEQSVTAETQQQAQADAFVVGPELESVILNLMEMGNFDRDLVLKALRAAYNNPDRAAEFLFSGNIPEAPPAGAMRPRGIGGPLNPNSPLAFLSQDPQFQQLKSVIMQNPAMAGPILQQIGAANPRLLQVRKLYLKIPFLYFSNS